jgi:hypothetical protein
MNGRFEEIAVVRARWRCRWLLFSLWKQLCCVVALNDLSCNLGRLVNYLIPQGPFLMLLRVRCSLFCDSVRSFGQLDIRLDFFQA